MSGREAFFAAVNVSRETEARFDRFAELLIRWNPAINLVSHATLDDLWRRHFLDSAQLWALKPPETCHWVDLGSGGGFPGLVIALLAAEFADGPRVTLVESDARKSTFLATVARETGIDVDLRTDRLESLPPLEGDVVSARALAPLPRLLDWIAPHLLPHGEALLPKGAGVEDELAEALASWRFRVQKFPSRTDPRGVILKIGGLTRA